jgi:hypothetical protein
VSGPEFVVAARAGIDVAKSVVQEDPDVKGRMLDLADASPAMGKAAEAFARRQEVWQRVRLRILRPLAKFAGLSTDYFSLEFEQDLQSRLEGIPEEHIRTPPASVAVPAMFGLSYSLDDETLKDLYLNLIARSADDRRSDLAHPAFAEVIKQLSPSEARLLLEQLERVGPIVSLLEEFPATMENPTVDDIRAGKQGAVRSFVTRRRHLIPLVDRQSQGFVECPESEMWIDNWVRLGLMEVAYDGYLPGPEHYEWLNEHPEYLRLQSEVESSGRRLDVKKGRLTATAFGGSFLEAVRPIGALDEAEPATGS